MLKNTNWDRKSNPVAELLRKGADRIEKYGHAKYIMQTSTGSFCLAGSLCEYNDVEDAAFHTFWKRYVLSDYHSAAVYAVRDYLGIPKNRTVIEWNNAPERTAQEVIDAMRGTADKIEAEAEQQALHPAT